MPDPQSSLTSTTQEALRKKLDGIVMQMHANGEPDEAIQFVVDDFKKKYYVPQPGAMPLGTVARTAVSDLYHGIADPVSQLMQTGDLAGTIGGMVVDPMRAQGRQAVESARQGRYSEAFGHGLASVIPVLGPMAASVGEQIPQTQDGTPEQRAQAAGHLTSAAIGLAAPEVIGRLAPRSMRIPAVAGNANAVERAAVAFGEREGIPIDAGTATGNRVVKATQHVADRSLGGGMVAETARAKQAEALASTGERLAARSGPARTAEQAGTETSGAIRSVVGKEHATASAAYDQLRAFEADPAHTTQVPVKETSLPAQSGPVKLSPQHEARLDDLLADARKQGYIGTRETLAQRYSERLEEARGVASALGTGEDAGYAGRDLLKDISDAGGIGIEHEAGGGMAGELESMMEGVNRSTGRTRDGKPLAPGFAKRTGGMAGMPNIVVRKGGLSADNMMEHVLQDPRWAGKFENLSDFMQAVDEAIRVENGTMQAPAGATGAKVSGIMRDLLGVKEGHPWWTAESAAAAPKTQSMGLAVDLTAAKSAMEPTYRQLMRAAEITPPVGAQGRALVALDRLMKAPDFAPLSVVDEALGELKSLARSQSDLPELRNNAIGQAIQNLDLSVKLRAGEAGPNVLKALEDGRKATRAKYAAADVLDALLGQSGEPVGAYNRMTAPKDSGVTLLRKVQQLAPNHTAAVARAYLDRLLEKATSEGGFGRAKGISADWERLGPETKKVLFRDPAYIQDLDNFFSLAKRIEDNPNPSGTAHTLLIAGQGGLIFTNPITGIASQVGLAGLSKLLHSKVGVKLLTQGLTLPLRAKVPAMALRARLLSAGLESAAGPAMYPAFAGASETGQPAEGPQ